MCNYCSKIYKSIEEILKAEYESIGNDEVCIVSDGIVYDGKHKRYDLVLPEVDGTYRAIADIKYCPYCGEQLIHKEV